MSWGTSGPANGSTVDRWYLLFMSDFVGEFDDYLLAFARKLTAAMNLIWRNCERWPGASVGQLVASLLAALPEMASPATVAKWSPSWTESLHALLPFALPAGPYKQYATDHLVTQQAYFSAYRDDTVHDIKSALRLAGLLEDFVLQNSDLLHGDSGPQAASNFATAY